MPGSVQLPAAPAVLLVLCLLSPLAAFRGEGRAGVTATEGAPAAAKPGGRSVGRSGSWGLQAEAGCSRSTPLKKMLLLVLPGVTGSITRAIVSLWLYVAVGFMWLLTL